MELEVAVVVMVVTVAMAVVVMVDMGVVVLRSPREEENQDPYKNLVKGVY